MRNMNLVPVDRSDEIEDWLAGGGDPLAYHLPLAVPEVGQVVAVYCVDQQSAFPGQYYTVCGVVVSISGGIASIQIQQDVLLGLLSSGYAGSQVLLAPISTLRQGRTTEPAYKELPVSVDIYGLLRNGDPPSPPPSPK